MLEEAERVYNNNKHLPYYEISTPNQMEKLDNFIKESFRIHRLPGKEKCQMSIRIHGFFIFMT